MSLEINKYLSFFVHPQLTTEGRLNNRNTSLYIVAQNNNRTNYILQLNPVLEHIMNIKTSMNELCTVVLDCVI